MIKDKFLSEITGKDVFTDEEYPLLREKYKKELAQKYAENPVLPPEKPPPVDKIKLQEELDILQTQGFEALQKFREEKSIQGRIAQIIV